MDELLAPLLAEVKRRGLSDAGFSRAAVGNPSALKNLRVRRGEGSRNHPLENLIETARFIGWELSIGNPRQPLSAHQQLHHGQLARPLAVNDDFVAVPTYEVRLSAGAGAVNDDQAERGALAFRRDWLDRLGVKPQQAMVLTVSDDSMTPTLNDGDLVLIVRERTTARQRGIFALVGADGEGPVKRAGRQPETLLLHSDNETCPTQIIPAADAKRVRILDEVVWWGHTVRELG